eukprot:scaffold30181_cov52-Attheya_sp.AAC.2
MLWISLGGGINWKFLMSTRVRAIRKWKIATTMTTMVAQRKRKSITMLHREKIEQSEWNSVVWVVMKRGLMSIRIGWR